MIDSLAICFLLGACLAAAGIQVALPFIPGLADAFRATPLDPVDWLLVAVVALLPAIVSELVRMRGRGRLTWVA